MIFPTEDEQVFVQSHPDVDPVSLLFRKDQPSVRMAVVAAQLSARRKAREKLPHWYANPRLVFPQPLSVEQASSERTAAFKASLVSGRLLIDLTGGMGVDSLAFSRRVERVVYLEQQSDLAAVAAHNFPLLGAGNIDVHPGNGLDFLQTLTQPADWIFLDPARRDGRGGKVVRLEDYEPRISEWYGSDGASPLAGKTDRVLLKTSPLIDIDEALRQLPTCTDVYVVAVDNECKEVLFVLASSRPVQAASLTAVNLRTGAETDPFTFTRAEEREAPVSFSDPLTYLYEPNAALLKAGAFRSIAHRFGLRKLAPNSHLYTSETPVPAFPGRVFEVMAVCKPDRKIVQELIPDRKASLSIRNFPESADTLRKKLGLLEGSDCYVFATTLMNNKKSLLITRKPAFYR